MLAPLRAFLVVIEEGSLNRAATRLRLSQPALTRQMQALEEEVGGRLFERTPAGVKPTDLGHTLAKRMQGVLAAYDTALAETRRMARGEREQLRIGYIASAAQIYLNPALVALRQAHPKMEVKLLDLSPGEQLECLGKGELDVAVIGQEGCGARRDFYTRKLVTLPVLAMIPADHPLAGRMEIDLAELRGEQFISSPEFDMPGRDRWIAQLCKKAGFRVRFGEVADSLSHGLSLIAGKGLVSLAPAYLYSMPAPGVAMVPLKDAKATWDFLVVWQRGKPSPPLNVFLEALAHTAQESCKGRGARS
ncbi:MAG: LysR substrate-binding domain-containing protein [Chthoniobacteraceae bacterium]